VKYQNIAVLVEKKKDSAYIYLNYSTDFTTNSLIECFYCISQIYLSRSSV